MKKTPTTTTSNNILVYTTPKVLEEKVENAWSYWSLASAPVKELIPYKSSIYFATKGEVQGQFLITEIDGKDIYFESWQPLAQPRAQQPFQGFKYFNE